MRGSALVFVLVFAITCVLALTGRSDPGRSLRWLPAFVLPFAMIAAGPAALERGRRIYSAWFVAGNAVNGVFLVAWARGLGVQTADVHLLLVGAVSSLFVSAISRQPFRVVLLAAAPSTLAAGGLHFVSYLDGRVDAPAFAIDALALLAVLGVGAVVALGNDLQDREGYRQQRVIEAQRATIAEQQALLEKELSHQVAERSRELGAALAKSDVTVDVRRLDAGERFAARYEIVRLLGAGGMGAVYEVKRSTDGALLALKCVVGEVSGAAAARFAREAEIGARVRHPNVVSIVDVGVSSGVPYLVMELVKGGSLEAQRSRFGDLPWALPILRQIAEGLAALHDAGVVHRDLKPANVLLTDSGAKISDFGISRFGPVEATAVDETGDTLIATPAGSTLTATGMVMGTPLYMAPEGAKTARALDAGADVFALGIIAYEMLTGSSPFPVPACLLAMADQPIPAPVVSREGVSADLARCVEAALEADPARRPRVRALAAALG